MNIPPKFISPTHNLKCYVLSATTSTWNDCFVELIDWGGKIWNLQKNLRWTLLTLSRHLNCTKKWKIQWWWWWWMILRVVSSTVCRCKLFVVHTFFISFKPLILSNYGKITWIVKTRINLLLRKLPKKYKMYFKILTTSVTPLN